MLNELMNESNKTFTENGAVSYYSTLNSCLDLLAASGAVRNYNEKSIEEMFLRAYCESSDNAVKIMFYTRDILQGTGERRAFRIMLRKLSFLHPESVVKNLKYIAEYGRYDDFFVLFGSPCEKEMMDYLLSVLLLDIENMKRNKGVSLLAKWMPSVNCSDKQKKKFARRFCSYFRFSQKKYRTMLSSLRAYIDITETHLCKKSYTFSYENVPSKALFYYRNTFRKNDKERYEDFIGRVKNGTARMHTRTLMPYEIVQECLDSECDKTTRNVLDTTWNSLENKFSEGLRKKNAIAVVDGSGSMYMHCSPRPIDVAISLGIYFAEKNEGAFKNHFITFSSNPRIIKIKGNDIYEKVMNCSSYCEAADTNLEKTFNLILKTALKYHLPQSELPEIMYIISDMEFNSCSDHSSTVYENAKAQFRKYGYVLPQVVFWNVCFRNHQFPVRMDETGTVLVSGYSTNILNLFLSNNINPLEYMKSILDSPRYSLLSA